MMEPEALQCKNCGAALGISRVCPYCGTRYVIETPVGSVRVTDVPEHCPRAYLDLTWMGEHYDAEYCMNTRLTGGGLGRAIGAICARLYQQGIPARELKYHLVIPPRLYLTALTLLETEKAPGMATNDKNVLPRFIECVWLDGKIQGEGCNQPWFLFVDEEDIFAIPTDRESVLYSTGTTF